MQYHIENPAYKITHETHVTYDVARLRKNKEIRPSIHTQWQLER